ncbi:MAG: metallophosphatase, partial [Pseudoalteromonas spongiae]
MTLPILLTGPMIRRAEPRQVTLFIVSSQQAPFKVNAQALGEFEQTQQILALGEHCFCHFYFLNSTSTTGFVVDTLISYQLEHNNAPVDLSAFYLDGQSSCSFVIAKQLSSILHGSCRNPHHESKDALITASHFLASKRKNSEPEPSLLVMSGDQIYADDVAGPMLLAIEQLIHQLKLFKEPNLIDELQADAKHTLYTRDTILPITKWHERSKLEFGYWLRQDLEHFTSLKSHNH